MWVANVGDLKNKERSAEFFLNLAWNAGALNPDAPARFICESTVRDFGMPHVGEITNVLHRLQSLSFARRPEHMQWHYSLTPYQPTELNETEIHTRLAAFEAL